MLKCDYNVFVDYFTNSILEAGQNDQFYMKGVSLEPYMDWKVLYYMIQNWKLESIPNVIVEIRFNAKDDFWIFKSKDKPISQTK